MAKAYANCTCETCGAKFEKVMYGNNRRDADSKAEWAERTFTECPECEEKRVRAEREAENAAAAIEAQESGLPALTGSEKQTAWATTIRQKIYGKLTSALEEKERKVAENEAAGKKVSRAKESCHRVRLFVDWLISEHAAAHWWIDNRMRFSTQIADILASFQAEFSVWYTATDGAASMPAPETPEEAALREDAEAEMTVAPANPTHGGAAEISVTAAEVSVKYERDEDFNAVVKGLGYKWDADRRVWAKAISETTGAAAERAAELGNKLLNAGFAVRIADAATRTAAINADYAPEHLRWITLYTGDGPHKGWLCVRLVRGDDLYDAAKKIKGSQYVKPNVAVPVNRWAEALDFADCYDYRISAVAQAAIDAERASIVTVAPAAAKVKAYDERRPEDIMSGAAGVLEDLADDD